MRNVVKIRSWLIHHLNTAYQWFIIELYIHIYNIYNPFIEAWTKRPTICKLYLQMRFTDICSFLFHGPLIRYVKLWVAHAPGMPETFSPPPRVSDPDIHQGTCVTRVPWCIHGSLASGFLWSQWRGKRPRYFRRVQTQRAILRFW